MHLEIAYKKIQAWRVSQDINLEMNQTQNARQWQSYSNSVARKHTINRNHEQIVWEEELWSTWNLA